MSNLITMVNEIASDVRRPIGFTNQIKTAIAAAVDFHRTKRMPFNEKVFTFSTVANQAYYTSTDSSNIPLIAKIDIVMLVDGTYEYELKLKPSDFIDEQGLVASSFRSDPEYIAYIRSSLRLFPTPNRVLTIRVDGISELIDSSGTAGLQRITRDNVLSLPNAYTSEWFTDGYEVIKQWAKGYFTLNTLKNPQEATAMFTSASDFTKAKKEQIESAASEDTVDASW